MSQKSSTLNSESNISHYLSSSLLRFPSLLEDLPAMLTALDSGECVNLMAISDVAKRESLVRLMELLPLQNSAGDGWFKAPGIVSVGGAMLMELLKIGSIKQPADLSEAEAAASRTAPLHLLSLLSSFPALLDELPPLLQTLQENQVVILDGLKDQDVAVGLEKFLRACGAVDDEDGDGLSLPSGPSAYKVRKTLSALKRCIRQAGAISISTAGGETPSPTDTSREVSHMVVQEKGGYAARATGSTDTNGGTGDERENENENDSDSSSGSEDFGPAPAGTGPKRETERVRQGPSLRSPAISASEMGIFSTDTPLEAGGEDVGREQWMLTTNENSVGALLGTASERKFAKGKQASAAAVALQQKKKAMEATRRAQSGDTEMEELMQAHQEARGQSLMELHSLRQQEQQQQQQQQQGKKRVGTFDYQRDIGSFRKRVDGFVRDQMVEDAKQLSSRFDRSIQHG